MSTPGAGSKPPSVILPATLLPVASEPTARQGHSAEFSPKLPKPGPSGPGSSLPNLGGVETPLKYIPRPLGRGSRSNCCSRASNESMVACVAEGVLKKSGRDLSRDLFLDANWNRIAVSTEGVPAVGLAAKALLGPRSALSPPEVVPSDSDVEAAIAAIPQYANFSHWMRGRVKAEAPALRHEQYLAIARAWVAYKPNDLLGVTQADFADQRLRFELAKIDLQRACRTAFASFHLGNYKLTAAQEIECVRIHLENNVYPLIQNPAQKAQVKTLIEARLPQWGGRLLADKMDLKRLAVLPKAAERIALYYQYRDTFDRSKPLENSYVSVKLQLVNTLVDNQRVMDWSRISESATQKSPHFPALFLYVVQLTNDEELRGRLLAVLDHKLLKDGIKAMQMLRALETLSDNSEGREELLRAFLPAAHARPNEKVLRGCLRLFTLVRAAIESGNRDQLLAGLRAPQAVPKRVLYDLTLSAVHAKLYPQMEKLQFLGLCDQAFGKMAPEAFGDLLTYLASLTVLAQGSDLVLVEVRRFIEAVAKKGLHAQRYEEPAVSGDHVVRLKAALGKEGWQKWSEGAQVELSKGRKGRFVTGDQDKDSWLFWRAGSDVGSCQSMDAPADDSKCLPAYWLDPKLAMVAVTDKEGRIVARSIVRLLIDDQGKAVLLRESFCPTNKVTPELQGVLNQLAIDKAAALKIPCVEWCASGGIAHSLHSYGGLPFEYVDSGQLGFQRRTNGVYHLQINVREL